MYGFIPYGKIIAMFIFMFAAASDWLDGYIARKYSKITNIGKFLDPIADKILVLCGLLLVIVAGSIFYTWVGVLLLFVIISRDLVVDCLRMLASSKGVVIAADIFGKAKTMATMVAIPYIFWMSINVSYEWVVGNSKIAVDAVGYGLLSIAVFLTLLSGVNYVIKNRGVLKEAKKESTEV